MAKTLFILNDPPYGSERSYNALRLAGALCKREGEEVKNGDRLSSPLEAVELEIVHVVPELRTAVARGT